MRLELSNITKYFGADLLFQKVEGFVNDKEIIGLIGNNGVGKSTLCNIITGNDHEFDGVVKKYPGVRIAYFRQMLDSFQTSETTVFEYILNSQEHVLEIEREYQAMLNRLQNEETTTTLLSEFGNIQETYELNGAGDLLERIEAVLNGLGIYENLDTKNPDSRNITYHSKLKELSGGERKIVELAVILLDKSANLLILDEPTNHLDMKARAWLEAFIKSFNGSVIIVSHDRHLLNNVVDQVWEIENFTLTTYNGNYDKFEKVKKERLDALRHQYATQKKELERLEEVVAELYRRVRIGANDRIVGQYNAAKTRVEHFKQSMMEEPPKDRAELNLSLQNIPPRGYTVVKLDHFSFGYDEKRLLLDEQTFIATKGDKIALLGANGTGKSTFLKLILTKYVYQHQLNPDDYGIEDFYKKYVGTVTVDKAFYVGPGIKIGYYSQHHSQLPKDLTIRELLWQHEIRDESKFQSLIRRYHFEKDTVDEKKIGDLSGGEKSKLQFILLMLSGANTLLLDEPINHLDIASMKVVEQVLHDFPGALIVISHDRYFLSRVINKIVYVKNRALHEYQQDIDSYIKNAL